MYSAQSKDIKLSEHLIYIYTYVHMYVIRHFENINMYSAQANKYIKVGESLIYVISSFTNIRMYSKLKTSKPSESETFWGCESLQVKALVLAILFFSNTFIIKELRSTQSKDYKFAVWCLWVVDNQIKIA